MVANGGIVTLKNALYVHGIKKNLIKVPSIANVGLHVHFVWLLKGILICMLLMRLSLLLQEEQSRVNRNTLIEETSFYYTKG